MAPTQHPASSRRSALRQHVGRRGRHRRDRHARARCGLAGRGGPAGRREGQRGDVARAPSRSARRCGRRCAPITASRSTRRPPTCWRGVAARQAAGPLRRRRLSRARARGGRRRRRARPAADDRPRGRPARALAALKVCPADDCQWAFYDQSRNRSAIWCDMEVCGNRHKVARVPRAPAARLDRRRPRAGTSARARARSAAARRSAP